MLAAKYGTVDYQGISPETLYNYKSTTTLPMTISMVITYFYNLGSQSSSAKR